MKFPAGVGAKGSSGVAGTLRRTEGGIGYVDTAYAIESKLSYAAVANQAGQFTLPEIDAVSAAARSVTSITKSNAISIVDPPASAKGATRSRPSRTPSSR